VVEKPAFVTNKVSFLYCREFKGASGIITVGESTV
jgi:hypothetical protein